MPSHASTHAGPAGARGLRATEVAGVAAAARRAAALIWRRLPSRVGSQWRLVDPLNRRALRLGAPAVAQTRMRIGHRMRLDLRSGTEWFAFYTGVFDDARIASAASLLRPGGTVVDAGANIGLWTVPLALLAAQQDSRVLVVEPVPANARRLHENLSLNGVLHVTDVVEVALSDAAGRVTMSLREDFADGAATGNASVAVDDGQDGVFTAVQVQATTLDNVLAARGGPVVDVVKADLEGHEDRFLAGAQATFTRHRPVAFVEWNSVYYRRRGVDPVAAVTPLLSAWDYRCLQYAGGTWHTTTDFTSDRELDNLVLAPSERADEVRTVLMRHGATGV
jgi:FkbM family methyltransferase